MWTHRAVITLVTAAATLGVWVVESAAVEPESLRGSSPLTLGGDSGPICIEPEFLPVRQYEGYSASGTNFGNMGPRHQLARDKKRRLIVNSDGNDAWSTRPVDEDGDGSLVAETRELFLSKRTRGLFATDNAIDTLVYELSAGTFGTYAHATNTAETGGTQRDWDLNYDKDCVAAAESDKELDEDVDRRGDPLCPGRKTPWSDCDPSTPGDQPFCTYRYRLSAYVDPLAEVLAYVDGLAASQHEREVFAGFRMNDTHDAGGSGIVYENNYSPFKLKDEPFGKFLFGHNPFRAPQAWVDEPPPELAVGRWSAVDYGASAVRHHVEMMVKEAISKYDVDGVQLNFMRHPIFFRSTAWEGGTASACERAQMTDMMVRIRNQANLRANVRGKPVLVSIMIPDSMAYSYDIGLDVQDWIDRGLVDLIVGADYMQLQPWADSAREFSGKRVKFYAGFSDSRLKAGLNLRRTAEAFRGRAHEALAQGVDGIQISNGVYNDPAFESLYSALGSVKATSASDMLMFGSYTGYGSCQGNPQAYLSFFSEGTRPLVAPDHPLRIAAASSKRWSFSIGSGIAQRGASIYVLAESVSPSQLGGDDRTDALFYLRLASKRPRRAEVYEKVTPEAGALDRPSALVETPRKDLHWLRFDVPPELLGVRGQEPPLTLVVDLVNDDPASPIVIEDIILHTTPGEVLRPLLSLTEF